MPTIEDALGLLSDPANRGMTGESNGMVLMAPPATVGGLQAMGARIEDARELVRIAAEQLGGEAHVHVRKPKKGGRSYGRPVEEDEIWIPAAALRPAPAPD
jgi:hypothetical protein